MAIRNAPGAADAGAVERAQEALDAFAKGLDGLQPNYGVVELAASLAEAALSQIPRPEVSFDIDGELSFDLRTASGHLIFAELTPHGALDASVYDRQDKLVKRMTSATAEELIAWFQG